MIWQVNTNDLIKHVRESPKYILMNMYKINNYHSNGYKFDYCSKENYAHCCYTSLITAKKLI